MYNIYIYINIYIYVYIYNIYIFVYIMYIRYLSFLFQEVLQCIVASVPGTSKENITGALFANGHMHRRFIYKGDEHTRTGNCSESSFGSLRGAPLNISRCLRGEFTTRPYGRLKRRPAACIYMCLWEGGALTCFFYFCRRRLSSVWWRVCPAHPRKTSRARYSQTAIFECV